MRSPARAARSPPTAARDPQQHRHGQPHLRRRDDEQGDLGEDTGLVGNWKLDEPSGAAIADSSGYGNGGNLVGGFGRTTPPPAITFSDPNAATFDGTAYSILGITGIPANNAPQTISVWVNLTSNAGVQNFVTLINGGSGSAVQVGIRNPNVVVWSYGGGTLASAPLTGTGAWHHITYTYDGTTHRLYLDGVAGTPTTNPPQTSTPTQTYLGSYDGANEFLQGALDDVRVYNRALSPAEVTTLAGGSNLAGRRRHPHLHGYPDVDRRPGDRHRNRDRREPAQHRGQLAQPGGVFTGTGAVTLTATDAGNVVVSGGSSFRCSASTVTGARIRSPTRRWSPTGRSRSPPGQRWPAPAP